MATPPLTRQTTVALRAPDRGHPVLGRCVGRPVTGCTLFPGCSAACQSLHACPRGRPGFSRRAHHRRVAPQSRKLEWNGLADCYTSPSSVRSWTGHPRGPRFPAWSISTRSPARWTFRPPIRPGSERPLEGCGQGPHPRRRPARAGHHVPARTSGRQARRGGF